MNQINRFITERDTTLFNLPTRTAPAWMDRIKTIMKCQKHADASSCSGLIMVEELKVKCYP